MTKKILVMATLLICASFLSAQSLLSAYYPFGIPITAESPASFAQGDIGVSNEDETNVLLKNPANLGAVSSVAFSTLLSINYLRSMENGKHTDQLNVFPTHIAFAFPLSKFGTIGFAYKKSSNFDFRYKSGLGNDMFRIFDISGGISSWQGGWGMSLFNKKVKFGLSAERIYIKKESTFIQEISETVSRDSTKISGGGYGASAGAIFSIAKLSAGISFTAYKTADLNAFRGLFNGTTGGLINQNAAVSSIVNIKLPSALSVGMSYNFSPKLSVSTDLNMIFWSTFESSDKTMVDNKNKQTALSYSTGLKFIPAPQLLFPKYYQRMHYMLGFRTTQLPDNKSRETAGSLGISFPLKGHGLLTLAAQGGRRKTDLATGYNEDFIIFSVGFSGGKKWSRRSDTMY